MHTGWSLKSSFHIQRENVLVSCGIIVYPSREAFELNGGNHEQKTFIRDFL